MFEYVSKGQVYTVLVTVIGDARGDKFSPAFKVRSAAQRPDETLHRSAGDEWESPFPSYHEAQAAALKTAKEWIDLHGGETGNG